MPTFSLPPLPSSGPQCHFTPLSPPHPPLPFLHLPPSQPHSSPHPLRFIPHVPSSLCDHIHHPTSIFQVASSSSHPPLPATYLTPSSFSRSLPFPNPTLPATTLIPPPFSKSLPFPHPLLPCPILSPPPFSKPLLRFPFPHSQQHSSPHLLICHFRIPPHHSSIFPSFTMLSNHKS